MFYSFSEIDQCKKLKKSKLALHFTMLRGE